MRVLFAITALFINSVVVLSQPDQNSKNQDSIKGAKYNFVVTKALKNFGGQAVNTIFMDMILNEPSPELSFLGLNNSPRNHSTYQSKIPWSIASLISHPKKHKVRKVKSSISIKEPLSGIVNICDHSCYVYNLNDERIATVNGRSFDTTMIPNGTYTVIEQFLDHANQGSILIAERQLIILDN